MVRPAVLVLQHVKENPRKCSLTHLRGRSGIEFLRLTPGNELPRAVLDADRDGRLRGIVLAVDAPVLDSADAEFLRADPSRRLILVDGNWAKIGSIVAALERRAAAASPVENLRFRSVPTTVRTAYPRRSKLRDDPAAGLASVEALAAAFCLLDCAFEDLLEGYYWKQEFLDLNEEMFARDSGKF